MKYASDEIPTGEFPLKPGGGEEPTKEKGTSLFRDGGHNHRACSGGLSACAGIRIAAREGSALDFTLTPTGRNCAWVPGEAGSGDKKSVLDSETEQWNLLLLNI